MTHVSAEIQDCVSAQHIDCREGHFQRVLYSAVRLPLKLKTLL